MTRAALNATIGTVSPSLGRAADPYTLVDAQNTLVGTAKTNVATAKTSTASALVDAGSADTALGTVTGADTTAVEAAVATLEADGAAPTQAHVNALRTVWNTLVADGITAKAATVAALGSAGTADTNTGTAKTAVDAISLTASLAAVAADVSLLINSATVVSKNKLNEAIRALLRLVDGSDLLS